MSVFPRHVSAGQSATIHLRVAVATTCFPLARVAVRDPNGVLTFEDTRQLSACVPAPARAPDLPREQPAFEGISESLPLTLVAHHLREDADERAELVRLLTEMGHCTHCYWHWQVPPDAAAGCYRVELAVWLDGTPFASQTAANDLLFVEKLSLQAYEASSQGHVARVRNHSPEPTRARLHELSRGDGGWTAAVRVVELPGAASSEVTVKGDRGLLVYAEGAASLWLHAPDDTVYVRDPSCAWMAGRDESVVVTARIAQRSFTLKGPARAVWLQADGLARRSELERLGADALRSLVAAGILKAL